MMAFFSSDATRFAMSIVLASMMVFVAEAMDTDNDGLLDLLDAPRYDTTATGTLTMIALGIEDLDGVSSLSSELIELNLGGNRITSIESGDFTGLNITHLKFWDNQIANIEPGAFAGLYLKDLNLNNNPFTDLHMEGGIYEKLYHLGIQRHGVKRLFLDNAQISELSYDEVVRETTGITDLSIVGLTFLGDPPGTLQEILSLPLLDSVVADATLFDAYADDFTRFAAIEGNVLNIVGDLDCNRSGNVEFTDLSCIQDIADRDSILSTLDLRVGDLDGDGQVVFRDFLALAQNFGRTSATYLQGNLDLANSVGFPDFLLMAANFGARPAGIATGSAVGAEPVPEPNPNGLLALGLFFVLHSFRIRGFGPTT